MERTRNIKIVTMCRVFQLNSFFYKNIVTRILIREAVIEKPKFCVLYLPHSRQCLAFHSLLDSVYDKSNENLHFQLESKYAQLPKIFKDFKETTTKKNCQSLNPQVVLLCRKKKHVESPHELFTGQ